MNITIQPRLLRGEVHIPPSKSMAHRMLICAALSDNHTELICRNTSRDIEATAQCLNALGAKIIRNHSGYTVFPISSIPESAQLPCGESGATLRFLLPIVGAFGVDTTFHLEGRLPQRPISPLWEEMERMGCKLCRPTENTLRCCGKLRDGEYKITGDVSSQFISGLLFALSLLPESTLEITSKVESAPYIAMTKAVMAQFYAPNYHSPGKITVDGDWSSAAFWIAANALGSDITVNGCSELSCQGDKTIIQLAPKMKNHTEISVADIPDLVPILAVVAAQYQGAVFTDISRLRLKESDRVAAILSMIKSLGGKAEADKDTLTVFGTGLTGGCVDSFSDHRIAMAAAIAATVCKKPVTVSGAECVNKSYPKFWDEYSRLGGKYVEYVRK